MGFEHRDQFSAVVRANLPLCREHFRLVLAIERFPSTEPGQFVQLACRELSQIAREDSEFGWDEASGPPGLSGVELAGPLAMLRRPFSLAGRRDCAGVSEIDIIHRVVGIGTDWLSRLKVGDEVGVLGPLGNKFELPEGDREAILVGGGVGIPPMVYLAENLAGRRALAFSGALTRDLLPLSIVESEARGVDDIRPLHDIEEFARHQIPTVITTDDGSYGFRGYVTQALERYLDERDGTGRLLDAVIYTCGPEPMMKRVADIALSRGIECQIAAERAMACGMGTCQSCCIRVKKLDPNEPPLVGKDWCYRLACTDGPVFRAADLLW